MLRRPLTLNAHRSCLQRNFSGLHHLPDAFPPWLIPLQRCHATEAGTPPDLHSSGSDTDGRFGLGYAHGGR